MRRKEQRGFSLVSAVFILVVLAALGTFMVSLSGSQHLTAAGAAQGARAFYAARSGVEWGAARAINGPSCIATTPVALPAYAEFNVTVTCEATPHTESGVGYSLYRISATVTPVAATLGEQGFVSRTVQLIVSDAP